MGAKYAPSLRSLGVMLTFTFKKTQKSRLNVFSAASISPKRSYTLPGFHSPDLQMKSHKIQPRNTIKGLQCLHGSSPPRSQECCQRDEVASDAVGLQKKAYLSTECKEQVMMLMRTALHMPRFGKAVGLWIGHLVYRRVAFWGDGTLKPFAWHVSLQSSFKGPKRQQD